MTEVRTVMSFKMRKAEEGGSKAPAALALAAITEQVLVIICPTALRPLSVCVCVCCTIIKSARRGGIRE